jgi:membrane peptidoglycan carboxypeptidase
LRIVDYPRAEKQGVRRFVPSWRLVLGLCFTGLLGVAGLFGLAYAMVSIPEPNDQALEQTSVVYYRDGKTEIGRFGESNRIAVSLDQVPQHVRDAVLAAEDRTFYSNRGISPTGIARAFYSNLRNDSTQGGSTITQQYVKNVYLSQERTLSRKLKEVVISVKVANQDSKEKILEDYLNTIYWGRGAYGVQTASQAYFRKDVSKLDVSEAAFLAGIIQAPSSYDPARNPEGAERRWNYALSGMVATGALTEAERAKLTFPEVSERKVENRLGGPKGYLIDVVRDELVRAGISEAKIETGGLKIRTTFDQRLQRAAEKAVKDERPREDARGVHVGLSSVRPGTGEVVAMYGGRDYVRAPGRNAATAKIQGGSTFKAFTLAAALDEGISLDSRYAGNGPLEVPGSKPVQNQGDRDYGYSVDLRYATANSINTAFVDLTMELGAEKVRDAAVASGIPSDAPGLEADARVTLGTASVSAVDVANAYATFAAEGERVDNPHTVIDVADSSGEIIYKASVSKKRAWSRNVAANVTDALEGVVEYGSGTKAQEVGRPVTGKTGTAEDLTAWFAGYAPQLSTAVSFHRGDGTKSLDGVAGMSTFTGGAYPAAVWTAFMEEALEGTEVVEFPDPEPIGERVDSEPRYEPRSDDDEETSDSEETEQPDEEPTTPPTRTPRPTAPAPTREPEPDPTVAPPTQAPPTQAPPTQAPEPDDPPATPGTGGGGSGGGSGGSSGGGGSGGTGSGGSGGNGGSGGSGGSGGDGVTAGTRTGAGASLN